MRRDLRIARSACVAAMAPVALDNATRAITGRIAPLICGGAVGGYVAHRGEPDIRDALLAAGARGHPVALPRVSGGAMRFLAWHPDMAMRPGPAGIAEPDGDDALPVATLIVPLVGFDRRAHRLGQGGGHYDRWLAAHPGARTIGAAWSVQEVDAVPHDPWDIALDFIVTERETIAA